MVEPLKGKSKPTKSNSKLTKSATFSPCNNYRYTLSRCWDKDKPYAMFIGLNPSTADEENDDPTIRRCINYAKDWGYGGLYMLNLFAYRATAPSDMMAAKSPVREDNDKWLLKISKEAGIIIAAWGNDGSFKGRSEEIKKLITGLKCLKVNKSGEPAHPLYQPKKAVPIAFS